MPVQLIKSLAARGMVSLDVQGYLRKVENKNVCAIDWLAKEEALQYVSFLKASWVRDARADRGKRHPPGAQLYWLNGASKKSS